MKNREKIEKQINCDIGFLPAKQFFSLKEICALKGLNIRTAYNKPHLLPDSYVHIGGARKYSRLAVLEWLSMTDEELIPKEAIV